MFKLALIAAGGALGALSRYGLGLLVAQWWSARLPLGTLLVNVLGSFTIGIVFVLIAEKAHLHSAWQSILSVGFLGAFTTFSTFSLETINLLQQGEAITAAGYVVLTLLACLLAAGAGIWLSRLVF